ncbi:MAG: aspartate/glutamate racemase family protein [Candidatus Methanomethyliaceae archaeon]
MRILVINPNSSKRMTELIEQRLVKIKHPNTECVVVRNEDAPEGVESDVDIARVVPGVLRWVQQANGEGYDAIIIACFSDPGLTAAREISRCLVLGIEETSLHIACILGQKFTVLTPLPQRRLKKEHEVRCLGLAERLASVRALGISVAETGSDPERTRGRLLEVGRQAVMEDGAEVLILGCAGMVGYADLLEKELGVTVIDPTSVTFKVAEVMVELGLRHSKGALCRGEENLSTFFR